mgnify:CR=1 FL=1
MKSIKNFEKLSITEVNKIYGGVTERTEQGDGKGDKVRMDGSMKTNIDWNPFNNDCVFCD